MLKDQNLITAVTAGCSRFPNRWGTAPSCPQLLCVSPAPNEPHTRSWRTELCRYNRYTRRWRTELCRYNRYTRGLRTVTYVTYVTSQLEDRDGNVGVDKLGFVLEMLPRLGLVEPHRLDAVVRPPPHPYPLQWLWPWCPPPPSTPQRSRRCVCTCPLVRCSNERYDT